MTQTLVFANAQVIEPGQCRSGAVVVHDDKIVEILPQGAALPAADETIDCAGDFVAPGLIELHTDNLERHMHPRPKVDWPHAAAIIAHDAELAGTGITTVFDAIRVGSILSTPQRGLGRYARGMADEILAMRTAGALKISHHLHLRAEVCSETLIEELDEFGPDDRVGIVSVMDHTPGQRQFRDLDKFRAYVGGKTNMPPDELEAEIKHLYALQARLGQAHEAATVAAAKRYGAVLASHDDTTPEQVATSAAYGIALAEFPTTVAAARACHDHGISVIMGAPNLIRGGSHSGNVAAHELADLGLLDILSSDYVPAALLLAAVRLGDLWDDMARGIATVTQAPAKAAGLTDRGALKPGLRADIIRFGRVNQSPVLRGVWVSGYRI